MLSSNQATHLSKLLSYILRHKPEEYKIGLDKNGYTSVDELINKLNAHNENISFEIRQHIVDTSNNCCIIFQQYKSATQGTMP